MTATTEYASAPESAKMLKSALRAAFPATKFAVRIDRGTAYGWCSVRWTDGPTRQRVEAITSDYEGTSFDGMTDSTTYLHTKLHDGRVTGLRGINCERRISPALARRCAEQVATFWGGDDMRAPLIAEYAAYDGEICWKLANQSDDFASQKRTGEYWTTLIHQAASDRTKFARTLSLVR